MGNSSSRGPTGKDVWAPSPRTGGPLGTNKDAADPATPVWFVGDTPGPTGKDDRADPNGEMYHRLMCRQRSALDDFLSLARRGQEAACQKVEAELEEARKIRDAYADVALLREARQKNWDGEEYNVKVAEKVFGKSGAGSSQPTYYSPMHTDPLTCRIKEGWDIQEYRKRGIPEVIYQADRAHEEVHRKSCASKGVGSSVYAAEMSFPEKRSADEVKAYNAKVAILEAWLEKNCH